MNNRNHFLKKLIVVLGVLFILEFVWSTKRDTTAQLNDNDSLFSNITVSYIDPMSKLESEGGTLIHRAKMNVEEGHFVFNSAEIWRGDLNELEIGINYTKKLPSDLTNGDRLVIVLRDSSGIPWYIGDFSFPKPNRTEPSNGIIWIRMTMNQSVLQKISDERAVSSFEIGIAQNNSIAVAGPGELAEEERASLTPLHTLMTIDLSQK